jgi:hypothetical protein
VNFRLTSYPLFLFAAVGLSGEELNSSGLEFIFQLVHLIFTDFKWEEDALMRAKKIYAQSHDMTVNSLEGTEASCPCFSCG